MAIRGENPEHFESRKADHIRLALEDRMQASGQSGFDRIRLIHEALPDLDFEEIDISTEIFSRKSAAPLFVSSMTAGHAGGYNLNMTMARVCERKSWIMAVGSQRRQLTDVQADGEWRTIRKECPEVRFIGNIGIAQLIETGVDDVRRLAETLQAEAMFVHLNPLQECLQPEGTPRFRGGLRAIESLTKTLGLPVIVKETGCGFSRRTLETLKNTGVAAVDISGLGGTHWGRIEGGRAENGGRLSQAALTFGDWGVPTIDSLVSAVELRPGYAVWASGGVRNGLDAAKCLAVGAEMVGLAKPIIEAAHGGGEAALENLMNQLEFELKTALFCTGSKNISELRTRGVWEWSKI